MDVNGREYLARMAELFDLPADVAAGLSHMELLGDRQLLLEGHEGLLAYGTELIDVSVGGAVLRVTGRGADAQKHDRARGAHRRTHRRR